MGLLSSVYMQEKTNEAAAAPGVTVATPPVEGLRNRRSLSSSVPGGSSSTHPHMVSPPQTQPMSSSPHSPYTMTPPRQPRSPAEMAAWQAHWYAQWSQMAAHQQMYMMQNSYYQQVMAM